MYQFKQERLEEVKKYNLSVLSEKIGISRVYLSYIIHNKNNCRKAIAYSITKAIDENKEIDYFFIKSNLTLQK